ncbi:MAG: ribosome recycling factor [Rickettsiales bacterium]|nr:ribosome recycling factor [Rickettsiales bacterium]MCA0254206.1 ribosome recycling factor [Pseudomonadota bacterium]
MDKALKSELTEKMEKAMAVLDKELKGLRTGRASVNLLDPVVVEAYGSKMPISQVGTVSTPDAKTISVQVWDKAMVKTVEKAIADANLGLNPSSDGQLIRMSLPVISQERRKELVKLAHKYGENTKVALRNIRRDGMDILKKMEKEQNLSKDEHHNQSEEIQKLTDDYISKVDNVIKSREEEILTI